MSVPYRATCWSTTFPIRRTLPDGVLVHAGEVEPHRAASAAVEIGALAGHERHVLAQRSRKQVGGVDVVGQVTQMKSPARGPGPVGLRRQELRERVEHGVPGALGRSR